MRKIRYGLIVMAMLLCSATSAAAELRIGIGIWTPNVSIGINLPTYPQLVPVPGYPVYYAPQLQANYFFYDGMYWVYYDDNWYASSWYNGPWGYVEPYDVPLFVLRIPVRYYRSPPGYFRGWRLNAPPRWGHHWGPDWERQRSGWNRWQRSSVPARAPLPAYQRQYSGKRYPQQVEKQREMHNQQYRYQPKDPVIRERFQQRLEQRAPEPAQRERQEEPRRITPRQEESQRPATPRQGGTRSTPSQPQPRGEEDMQRSAPGQRPPQQPDADQRKQKQQEAQWPEPPRQDRPKDTPPQQPGPKLQEQKQKAIDKENENEEKKKGQEEKRGRGRNY
ncbi:MAG: hypothetical protein A2512_05590 [Deltaproteobacteria bacterium RIFOXYD12_FULL_56_24]|nr:MAG: hypothetical protein A2512_05590 [Deltaproteobacteria bacterium RIFOXYD12_FULL_56_24]